MIKEDTTKLHRRVFTAVIPCLIAATMVLVGCGKTNETVETSDSSMEASTTAEDVGLDATSDDVTDTATDAGSAATSVVTLPELEEGEVLLGNSSGQTGEIEGKIPDDLAEWSQITKKEPNAIAAVNIPETAVTDVPVTENGKNGAKGDIVLDSGNGTDFTDPVVVLYDSEGIDVYGDSQFFESNPYIYVYTQDMIYEYRVFAAYQGDSTDLLIKHDMYDYEDYCSYVDEVMNVRSIGANVDSSMTDAVKSTWQMLVITDGDAGEETFMTFATLTASKAMEF